MKKRRVSPIYLFWYQVLLCYNPTTNSTTLVLNDFAVKHKMPNSFTLLILKQKGPKISCSIQSKEVSNITVKHSLDRASTANFYITSKLKAGVVLSYEAHTLYSSSGFFHQMAGESSDFHIQICSSKLY